jgi:hypothetical protein
MLIDPDLHVNGHWESFRIIVSDFLWRVLRNNISSKKIAFIIDYIIKTEKETDANWLMNAEIREKHKIPEVVSQIDETRKDKWSMQAEDSFGGEHDE